MRKIIDTHVHLKPMGLAGTTDQRFHIRYGEYGQVTLINGVTVNGLPQYWQDGAFTAQRLIHHMDSTGVEKSVILAGAPTNIEDTVDAVQRYPGRLYGAMTLKLDDNVENQMRDYHRRGLTAIKFEMSVVLGYMHPSMYPDFKFDSPIMERVYREAARLGLTVVIDPNRIGAKSYQVEELDKVTTQFPDTRFVLCHMAMPDPQMVPGDEKYARWQQMTSLVGKPNVWSDVSGLPSVYVEEEYPYPTVAKLLRELMDKYGSRKFVWASDIPSTFVFATYTQMVNMFERSPLFTEEEKDRLFYYNALDAFSLN